MWEISRVAGNMVVKIQLHRGKSQGALAKEILMRRKLTLKLKNSSKEVIDIS